MLHTNQIALGRLILFLVFWYLFIARICHTSSCVWLLSLLNSRSFHFYIPREAEGERERDRELNFLLEYSKNGKEETRIPQNAIVFILFW